MIKFVFYNCEDEFSNLFRFSERCKVLVCDMYK